MATTSVLPGAFARVRAGTAVHSLLTTICGAAALLTAAIVLDPASLQAGSSGGTAEGAKTPTPQQELTDFLSTLVSTSEQVLALNPGEGEGGCEILLWFIDTHEPGRINADELTLIRHSPLFKTIMVYNVPPQPGARDGINGRWSASGQQPVRSRESDNQANGERSAVGAALSEADVVAPGFIDRWRAMSMVEARMIARGISDMRVDEAGRVDISKLSHLHLRLTWESDSVDGAREVSAVVAAGRRHAGSADGGRAAGVTQ